MPSSYSTRNRAEKQAAGENSNTWGTRLNTNTIDMFDAALDGRVAFTLSTTKTLTTVDGAADEARMRFIDITDGTGGTVTIPNVEKWYLVRNGTSGDVTFTTGSGTTATIKTGAVTAIVSTGANVVYAEKVDVATQSVGTLAVANGGTGVTTSTGTGSNVLSDSPTLTGTLSGAAASFSGALAADGIGKFKNGEAIRLAHASPIVTFYNAAEATRFGYINHNGTNLLVYNEVASSNIIFNVGGTTTLNLSTTGAQVTGTLSATDSIKSSSATGGVGYATGAGGTVTQATDKATGVTLNKVSGQITMNAASLAAGAAVSFVLTNSAIAATDAIIVNIGSGATANAYKVEVTAVAAGSCRIQLHNFSGAALAEALVLNFAVIKAVAS